MGIAKTLKFLYNLNNAKQQTTPADSGSRSGQADNSEYVECYNQALARIASCEIIINNSGCSMIGCGDNTVECGEDKYGRSCRLSSGAAYYQNTYGFETFYCDTEDKHNQGRNVNEVIGNICL